MRPLIPTVCKFQRLLLDFSTHERGSIKQAPLSNLSDYTLLQHGLGDSLKDIHVFSKEKQKGTNPCAINNGGCQELCLFNGTQPVCACAHGKITSKDGKTCEGAAFLQRVAKVTKNLVAVLDYDSFLMFSRVTRIDSIHMFDEFNPNSPFQSIKSADFIKNAIGITFDYKRQTIYYSDIQKSSINSVYFNGSSHRVVLDSEYQICTSRLFY